jgi:hypothetical protein
MGVRLIGANQDFQKAENGDPFENKTEAYFEFGLNQISDFLD